MKEFAVVNKRDYRFIGALIIAIIVLICSTFLAAWFRTPEAYVGVSGVFTTVFAYFLKPPGVPDQVKQILGKDPESEKEIEKKNQKIEQLKRLLEEHQIKLNSSNSSLSK